MIHTAGFEPTKLTHDILSVAPLTARENVLKQTRFVRILTYDILKGKEFKSFYYDKLLYLILLDRFDHKLIKSMGFTYT